MVSALIIQQSYNQFAFLARHIISILVFFESLEYKIIKLKTAILSAALLFAVGASAQDPLRVAPHAYRLEFENEWVKVTRVRYAPGEKLVAHEHPPLASAFVYLNDGGPVIFRHLDKDKGAITRPATTAGGFRLFRGQKEVHMVENLSDRESDFLRVEFKTDPADEGTLSGRFFRPDYTPGESFQVIQFENRQVRVTRLILPWDAKLNLPTSQNTPSLFVALSPVHLKVSGADGKVAPLSLKPGQVRWVGGDRREQFEHTGDDQAELLRFDFKTNPLPKGKLERTGRHDHSKRSMRRKNK